MNASAVVAAAQTLFTDSQLDACNSLLPVFLSQESPLHHKIQPIDSFSVCKAPSDYSVASVNSNTNSSSTTPVNGLSQESITAPLPFLNGYQNGVSSVPQNFAFGLPPSGVHGLPSSVNGLNFPVMFLSMPSTSAALAPQGQRGVPEQQQPDHSSGGAVNSPLQGSTRHDSNIPVLPPQMPAAPKCSICGADSTGIHFGVEACAACSAFFRRTVVLSKNYLCNKEGQCSFNFDSPTGQKCRSCRFKKCLEVGMDRNAVQHRRDAIGKYSSAVKRECSSPMGVSEGLVGSSDVVLSPPSPKSPKVQLPSVMEDLDDMYTYLNRQRKLMYSNTTITSMMADDDLVGGKDTSLHYSPLPRELDSFMNCMFQLFRVEPRLCLEMVRHCKLFNSLSTTEKVKIFHNFVIAIQAVEEPYLTWQYTKSVGATSNRFWVMPNRTFVDFERIDHYFDSSNDIMKGLKLEKKTAINLFQPSFQDAMSVVGTQMQGLDLTRTELICLLGFALYDPTVTGLLPETQQLLQNCRDQLLREMMNHFMQTYDDPELRFAEVILVMSGIKVHAQKTRVNMTMIRLFDLVPRDAVFDELLGMVD